MDLKAGAETYFYLNNAEISSGSEDERKWLDRLRRLGDDDGTPLIYQLFSSQVDARERLVLLKQIEFLLFCRTLWGRQVAAHELDLQYIALKLAAKEVDIASVATQISNAVHACKVEIETASLKEIAREKGYYGWRAVRYFLYEYEMSLKEKSKTQRDKLSWEIYESEREGEDYSSIEHIYPQKAVDPEWKRHFDRYKVRERNVLRHSLGNLLPLSRPKNSSLRNKSFSEKKTSPEGTISYQYGGYSEIEVASSKEWTGATILLRGLKLLEFMERRWEIRLGDASAKVRQLGLEFVVSHHPELMTELMKRPIKK